MKALLSILIVVSLPHQLYGSWTRSCGIVGTSLQHRCTRTRHFPINACVAGSQATPWICSEDECPKWLLDGVSAIRAQNNEVRPLLKELRSRRFFRFYAADLLAGCTYLPTSEEPCELGACEVDACDDVPDEVVARDESEYEFELDSWARWDMPSDFTEYYDLETVPEGDTGYDGATIWRFIHSKISFQKDVNAVRSCTQTSALFSSLFLTDCRLVIMCALL